MGEDPYRPPRSEPDPDQGRSGRAALIEVVRAWERLRPAHNLALLVPVLVLAGWWVVRGWLSPGHAGLLVLGILMVANVTFFLGPVAETGFRAWFRRGEPPDAGRPLIFSAGLVISAGVVVLILLLARP